MDVNTAPGRPILVVDDERNIRKALELLFRSSGYPVIEAEDGEAALRQIEKLGPRLVLLDVEMPRLDGFETLHRLRRDSEVPVILLTVRNEDEDKDRGLQLGADDYITQTLPDRGGPIARPGCAAPDGTFSAGRRRDTRG